MGTGESRSPAIRGRGLKLQKHPDGVIAVKVARYTRAWIETDRPVRWAANRLVARYTRAWIETIEGTDPNYAGWSPAIRGRGLKRCISDENRVRISSPAIRGRGLKHQVRRCISRVRTRRPLYAGVD